MHGITRTLSLKKNGQGQKEAPKNILFYKTKTEGM